MGDQPLIDDGMSLRRDVADICLSLVQSAEIWAEIAPHQRGTPSFDGAFFETCASLLSMITRRTTILTLGAALVTHPLQAAPVRYNLDRANSRITFTYVLNGTRTQGRAVVQSANILLDVERPARSTVSATLDMTQARAGLFFATEAMQGAQVLDTKRFPTVQFQSKKIEGTVEKATLTGDLTIRDVTRTETFTAQLFRQGGTEKGDRSRLSILMKGQVDRRLYGADGYARFVGPMIGLEILTRITRA